MLIFIKVNVINSSASGYPFSILEATIVEAYNTITTPWPRFVLVANNGLLFEGSDENANKHDDGIVGDVLGIIVTFSTAIRTGTEV